MYIYVCCKNVEDGRTSLSRGVFDWLVSIRPSHLVYMSGDTCYLEPYVPNQFVRQFKYDQLYVGNPNTNMAFMGSLIDGARAWRYFIVSCTEARLCMPLRTLNLLMTLRFCQWYMISSSAPTGFAINSFGLKWIAQRLKQKVTAKGEGKRVWVLGIPKFIGTADSEAPDVESPRFEDVASAEVFRVG